MVPERVAPQNSATLNTAPTVLNTGSTGIMSLPDSSTLDVLSLAVSTLDSLRYPHDPINTP